MTGDAGLIACPFCETRDAQAICGSCGRDKSARRRVCRACGRQTLPAPSPCHVCGKAAGNDLRWKIPVIVGLFAAAIAVAVLIRVG